MREKYSDVLCGIDFEDNQKKHRKPAFFGYVAKTKGYYDAKHNLYVPHDTSMDYLYKILVKFRTPKVSKRDTNFSDLFMFDGYNPRAVNYRQINDIVSATQETQESIDSLFADKTLCAWYDRKDVIQSAKDCLYEKINVMHLNESTMLHLIKYLDNKKYSKINRLLFVTLFNYKHKTITNMLKSKEPVRTELMQDISGDIDLYGIKFSKVELPESEL